MDNLRTFYQKGLQQARHVLMRERGIVVITPYRHLQKGEFAYNIEVRNGWDVEPHGRKELKTHTSIATRSHLLSQGIINSFVPGNYTPFTDVRGVALTPFEAFSRQGDVLVIGKVAQIIEVIEGVLTPSILGSELRDLATAILESSKEPEFVCAYQKTNVATVKGSPGISFGQLDYTHTRAGSQEKGFNLVHFAYQMYGIVGGKPQTIHLPFSAVDGYLNRVSAENQKEVVMALHVYADYLMAALLRARKDASHLEIKAGNRQVRIYPSVQDIEQQKPTLEAVAEHMHRNLLENSERGRVAEREYRLQIMHKHLNALGVRKLPMRHAIFHKNLGDGDLLMSVLELCLFHRGQLVYSASILRGDTYKQMIEAMQKIKAPLTLQKFYDVVQLNKKQ